MRRKSKKGFYLTILLLVLIAVGGYFIFISEAFEREKPKIEIEKEIYWNLKQPLKFKISDNSGIKSYKIILDEGERKVTVDLDEFSIPKKSVEIVIEPLVDLEFKKGRAKLIIEAVDKSFWNYFLGNTSKEVVNIYIDTKRPNLYVVTNSYSITKGGSGLVIFKCEEDNLKSLYINTPFKKFEVTPFYKDGYYISLVAWDLKKPNFKADIVAIDRAGNKSRAYIPFFLKNRKYKESKIELKESFLKGKITELAQEYPETQSMSLIEKFKFVNETLREKNEALIHKLTSNVPKDMVSDFVIKPFYPLKGAKAVASFGDHRFYYYKGELISQSYHLGLDMASTKMAPIRASNGGESVFSSFNGIYGNMPLIHHGLGLYTLYGHCSTLFVKKGDNVNRGDVIAKTGMTGLALGDHLHFGVVVQGVEVRPAEWMDRRWIKLNIKDVIKDAKKVIDTH